MNRLLPWLSVWCLLSWLPVRALRQISRAAPPCILERLARTATRPYGNDTDAARPLREVGLDAIYVAHYTPLRTRLKHAQRELDKVGLQAKFITGWDRDELLDEDIRCFFPSHRKYHILATSRRWAWSWFKKGELSLAVKHAAAYYDIVKRGFRSGLVLEDDFVFRDGLVEQLTTLLRDPQRWETPGHPFSILFLGSFRNSTEVDFSRGLVTQEEASSKGAIGYIISQQGARYFLGHLPFEAPADHAISNNLCSTAPPYRYSHRPWLVVPWTELGSHGLVGTHQDSDFIRTDDLVNCVGEQCPCHSHGRTPLTIDHVSCCCNGASAKQGWTCPFPKQC